jgi:hypothetical protein
VNARKWSVGLLVSESPEGNVTAPTPGGNAIIVQLSGVLLEVTAVRRFSNHAVSGLLAVFLLASASPHELIAENPSSRSLYKTNSSNVCNALFELLFFRKDVTGRTYGGDVLDPYLWGNTRYLLTGQEHRTLVDLLHQFLSAEPVACGLDLVRQAFFQRDMLAGATWIARHSADRSAIELGDILQKVVQRAALSRPRFDSLAARDLTTVSITADGRPGEGSSSDLRSLLSSGSDWVCLGNSSGDPLAETHLRYYRGRSLFLVFLKTPGGRQRTLAYLADVVGKLKQVATEAPREIHLQAELSGLSVPVGTRVALMRLAILVGPTGELLSSNIVESIQARTYESSGSQELGQRVAEVDLRRSDLFRGTRELTPISTTELGYSTFILHPFDPFEPPQEKTASPKPVLSFCAACHGLPGAQSLLSLSRARFPRAARNLPDPTATTIDAEIAKQVGWLAKMSADGWKH